MLKIIAAVAKNGVIGRGLEIPWHLPDDMVWFKNQTSGCAVVMGRKTFDSLPDRFKPLPGRQNLVVSRKGLSWDPHDKRVRVLKDPLDIVGWSRTEDFFVIGGAEIYRELLPYADEFYLTRVHGTPEGDIFFPEWNRDEWELVSYEEHPSDERHLFSFSWEVWKRRQPAP